MFLNSNLRLRYIHPDSVCFPPPHNMLEKKIVKTINA